MERALASSFALQPGRSGLLAGTRAIVDPTVAVVTLLSCVYVFAGRITPPDMVLGALAFLLQYPSRLPFRYSPKFLTLKVARSWIGTIGWLFGLHMLTGLGWQFNTIALAAWGVLTPVLQVAVHMISPYVLRRLLTLRDRRRAVVVGSDEVGRAFARSLESEPLAHTDVIAFFDDRDRDRLGGAAAPKIEGRLKEVGEFSRHHQIDEIYIALPMSAQARIVEMLQDLRNSTASVWFIADVSRFEPIQARFDSKCGYPVVAVYDSPFVGMPGIVKRMVDILIASIALLLAGPLMLAVALAIKLDSRGPVIFKQRRYGLDGEEILVYKFRSMSVTEDGDSTYRQVQRGDSRVTRVGAFIRKTSLDELPQFINVLQGRMSVVGPRPHVRAVNERYRGQIPGYMLRHKVRPGITGWAQVHGLRGGDDLETMSRRIEFDLYYLRNWSLWLDLRIIARTIGVVFSDVRAF